MRIGVIIVSLTLSLVVSGCNLFKSPPEEQPQTYEGPPDPNKIILDFRNFQSHEPIGSYSLHLDGYSWRYFEQLSPHQLRILKPDAGEKLIFFVWVGDTNYRAQMILEKSNDCPVERPYRLRLMAGAEQTGCGPSNSPRTFIISGGRDDVDFTF